MIVNQASDVVVSNLGWVDGGSLWTYALGESESQTIFLSESRWLSIVMGSRDHFVLLHQGEQATTRLTAQSFTNVDEVISSIELQNSGPQSINSRFTGDTSVWSFLPKAYIVRAAYAPLLLFVNGVRAATQTQSLPWYAESYDVMYQGVLGVTEIPGSEYLLIAIQRDSKPLVYSPASRTIVKKLELAERHGNPQLYFRHGASELWASDYDTLVKLEAVGWRVLGSLHLQKGHSGMVSMNIGRFCFNADETLCAVARPHSGDVVGVDPASFTVTHRAETGAQPEDVALLRDDYFVARDWKTGKLLRGQLKACRHMG
jgi:hypothetical protein